MGGWNGVNSDPGASMQRTGGASVFSSMQDGLEGHLGSQRPMDPQGISSLNSDAATCTPPPGQAPKGAPEAYVMLVAERLRAAPKKGLRWAPACTLARSQTMGSPHTMYTPFWLQTGDVIPVPKRQHSLRRKEVGGPAILKIGPPV